MVLRYEAASAIREFHFRKEREEVVCGAKAQESGVI